MTNIVNNLYIYRTQRISQVLDYGITRTFDTGVLNVWVHEWTIIISLYRYYIEQRMFRHQCKHIAVSFCTSNYCIILYTCMLLIAQHLFINISHHGYNHRHFHDRRKIKSLKITITNIIPFFLLTKWKSTSIWRHSNSTVGFRGRMWATLKGRIHTSIWIQIWNIQIVIFLPFSYSFSINKFSYQWVR